VTVGVGSGLECLPQLSTQYSFPLESIHPINRAGKGGQYKPSNVPAQPLTLWGYEASPFVVVSPTLEPLGPTLC
jgi:hypothetical protein